MVWMKSHLVSQKATCEDGVEVEVKVKVEVEVERVFHWQLRWCKWGLA